MQLSLHLEQLERLTAKLWRIHAHEDPLGKLSFNEYDYLKVLYHTREAMRITDLAQEMRVSKPSATNMVQRLEKKGLVSRQVCSDDARSKRVALTPYAQLLLQKEGAVYQEAAAMCSENLTDAEKVQLVALLDRALKPFNG